MSDHRIYVACLASYNNGTLHGAWINASADVDDMQPAVDAMLRASKFPNVTVVHEGNTVPSAEEYAIRDVDGPWLQGIGESARLADVARRLAIKGAIESEIRDEDDALACFTAYDEHMGTHYYAKLEPDEIASAIRDAYRGSYDSRGNWAAEWFEETGDIPANLPQIIACHIDWDSVARDMEINGEVDFHVADGECYVFIWD